MYIKQSLYRPHILGKCTKINDKHSEFELGKICMFPFIASGLSSLSLGLSAVLAFDKPRTTSLRCHLCNSCACTGFIHKQGCHEPNILYIYSIYTLYRNHNHLPFPVPQNSTQDTSSVSLPSLFASCAGIVEHAGATWLGSWVCSDLHE